MTLFYVLTLHTLPVYVVALLRERYPVVYVGCLDALRVAFYGYGYAICVYCWLRGLYVCRLHTFTLVAVVYLADCCVDYLTFTHTPLTLFNLRSPRLQPHLLLHR